jgi:hypothetical protein
MHFSKISQRILDKKETANFNFTKTHRLIRAMSVFQINSQSNILETSQLRKIQNHLVMPQSLKEVKKISRT